MSTSINVKVSGRLEEHLKKQVSESGLYGNTTEYIRELIRKDLLINKEPEFKTLDELNTYLIKLANSPKEDFERIDIEDIVKNEYQKLKNETI